MPTDLVANLDALPAQLHASFSLQHSLAAATTTAAAKPGNFTIGKDENLARRAGVVANSKTVTFTIAVGAIANMSSNCFKFTLNTLGVTNAMDAKWKFAEQAVATVQSDTVALFKPGGSCLMLKDKPNINWRPGTKPVTVKLTINRPFLDALRAAGPGDITFVTAVAGYVAPQTSDDDDK